MLIMLAFMLQQDSRMGQGPRNREKWNPVQSKKTTLPYINGDCIVLANIVQACMNMSLISEGGALTITNDC